MNGDATPTDEFSCGVRNSLALRDAGAGEVVGVAYVIPDIMQVARTTTSAGGSGCGGRKEIAPEYQPMLIDLNQRGRAAVVTCHIHVNEFSDGQSGRPGCPGGLSR
jgi:hypothetical protein